MTNPSLPRPLLVFTALAILASQSIRSTAQSDAANPSSGQISFQLQINSNLVLVRVVVRDKDGNPVRGLKKDTFHLFDQGKEQTISQFEEVPSGESASSTTVSPSARTAASPVPGRAMRYIAFYFDDLNSSAADLIQARDAADRFFTTSLRPNDRVAIFIADKMLLDFTGEPRQIHEALMQLRASARGPANEHPCPDLSDYQAYEILHTNNLDSDAWRVAIAEAAACPVKIIASSAKFDPGKPDYSAMEPIRMLAQRILDQAQTLARANLQQFDRVVSAIAPAPGERSVVLVSPGFLSQSEQYILDRIIDRALHAQIVINTLDPKGLAVLLRESDASRHTTVLPDPHATQARHHLDASKEFADADVLAEFAQGTGGKFFYSDNDLKSGFAALTEDPPYYILAFSQQNVKWDGRFHALKVAFRTKERGLAIQARRGYFAVQSNTATQNEATKAPSAPSQAPERGNDTAASSKSVQPEVATVPASSSASAPEVLPPAGSPSATSANSAAEMTADAADSAPTSHANARPLHLHRGTNRVSVDQLEQFLTDAHGKSDAELAKQLTSLDLTQRVDSSTLLRLDARLPGEQSRRVLAVKADVAAFFKPPAPTVALPATPSEEDQLQWLRSATDYVTNTLHKLPNFFATRDVSRFADSPASQVMGTFYSYQPLHTIDHYQATVLYRDGKQVLDERQKTGGSNSSSPGLLIAGEFGPILGTVLTDASKSSVAWDRWEKGDTEPVAVYRFDVPRNRSHYEVAYCCVNAIGLYKMISAYHGEIAIDPATGSIRRIAIQADLKDAYPLTRADLLVEYGPVEIGGKTYVCPLHSVAIMNAYARAPDVGSQLPELVSRDRSGSSNALALPIQTLINDISFRQYHVFRSDSRILPAPD